MQGTIAGSVCAIALRRIGADVTVYETYPDPAASVGGFISLATNGLRALDAAGCLDAIQAYGIDVPLQRLWSSGGRLLGENPRGRKSDDLIHSITIRRADLMTALRTAAQQAGAQIVTDERVVDATDTGNHLRITLDNGNTVDSDLLVGADGIWSTIRTVLDTDAPSPDYSGIFTVFGTSTTPTPPGTFNMTMGRGGAFLHLAAGGETWWAAQVIDPTPDLEAVDVAMLRDRYRHEPQALAVLTNVTTMQPPTRDHVLAPVLTWRGDRIVFVGDAALAAYEDARRPRITRMLKAGHDNRARKKAAGVLRRRATDAVMSFGLKHFYEKATGWLYTYDVGELPVRV